MSDARGTDDHLGLEVDVVGDTVVIRLSGELDMQSAPLLTGRGIEELDRHEARNIVLDFASLTFLDSRGIVGLVKLHDAARVKGGSVTIHRPLRRIHRLLEVTGLVRELNVEDPVDDR